MALGGVPEGLSFEQPTQFDSPCEAQRKAQIFNLSSRRFMRWLRAKERLASKLLASARQAIEVAGPESAIIATARLAMLERFIHRAIVAPDTRWTDCPFAGFHDPSSMGNVFEDNEEAASRGCLLLGNAFGIANHWTQYCRAAISRHKSGRNDLIHEISPGEVLMAHVRDEVDSERYEPVVVDPQPRPLPRPPKFACQTTNPSGRASGRVLGVLEMESGSDFADLFRSRSPFPDNFPVELVTRFPR